MMNRDPKIQEAVNRRMVAWLQTMKDSPGKRLAEKVATLWDTDGEQSAVDYFRAECNKLGLERWEQYAVSDMTVAYRAMRALDKAAP